MVIWDGGISEHVVFTGCISMKFLRYHTNTFYILTVIYNFPNLIFTYYATVVVAGLELPQPFIAFHQQQYYPESDYRYKVNGAKNCIYMGV